MITVTWEVDDGSAGKPHPQHLEIDEEDLGGLEGDARKQAIEEMVQDDFESRISFYIKRIEES